MSPNAEHLKKFSKHLALCALLLFVSTVAAIGLLEIGVRAFFPAYDPSGQISFFVNQHGTVLGSPGETKRQTKNTGDYDVTVQFNRHGLRDAKNIAQARPDDIVVVGDSFAFGWGVEAQDRFSNLLQTRIDTRVFNLAIPGTNLQGYNQLLNYAESLGAKISRIVITVCMENDLQLYNAHHGHDYYVEKKKKLEHDLEQERPSSGNRFRPSIKSLISSTKTWLTYKSALYKLLTTTVHQNSWLRNLAVRADLVIPNLAGIQNNIYSREIIERSANKIANVTRRYDNAAVLIVPSRGLWAGKNRPVEARVHREFIRALLDRGIDVVDTKGELESRGDPLSYYFTNDGHWNKKGHSVGTKSLGQALTE